MLAAGSPGGVAEVGAAEVGEASGRGSDRSVTLALAGWTGVGGGQSRHGAAAPALPFAQGTCPVNPLLGPLGLTRR